MLLKKIGKMVAQPVIFFIKIYQKLFSFDHGYLRTLKPHGACRFYPTCSQYTIDAINKRGLIKGLFLGLNRLRKCHPFSNGGYDPIN